jgi:hypothetical protein
MTYRPDGDIINHKFFGKKTLQQPMNQDDFWIAKSYNQTTKNDL